MLLVGKICSEVKGPRGSVTTDLLNPHRCTQRGYGQASVIRLLLEVAMIINIF